MPELPIPTSRLAYYHQYMSSYGCLSRTGFILSLICFIAIMLFVFIPFAFVGMMLDSMGLGILRDLAFFIPLFFFGLGFCVLVAKRLHDIGISAWWGLGGLIPFIGTSLMCLTLLFFPGSDNSRYSS